MKGAPAGDTRLRLLSAGAAKGVAEALQDAYFAVSGCAIAATFGAVGAIREALDDGAPCDVIVLSAAMIDALADEGRVIGGTVRALGRVPTAIAVRAGEPLPAIGDAAALRASLLAAGNIFVPDPERATAGIHFAKVLRALGIYDSVAAALRPFPNGAIAMRALAASTEHGNIGCTQATEIRYTSGVSLAGPLPPQFALATLYAAAVMRDARDPDAARRWVEMLTGPESRELRVAGGFEP